MTNLCFRPNRTYSGNLAGGMNEAGWGVGFATDNINPKTGDFIRTAALVQVNNGISGALVALEVGNGADATHVDKQIGFADSDTGPDAPGVQFDAALNLFNRGTGTMQTGDWCHGTVA